MIPIVKTHIPDKKYLLPALEDILYSGYIAQGKAVEQFERTFEKYINNGYALSLNSGTAALHIALILAEVNPDDEVISTALTAEPTNVAIKMTGAKIRYADIDYNTGNISPQSIEANINKKTKAIMIVDYAGIPVNVPEIQQISKRHNIPVIHDAAHALGARFNGNITGSHFQLTAFSFQAIKHITTVDGGILHIQDKDLYDKAKLIRWFGLDKTKKRLENNIQIQGYKYHMNNVNATIGLVQFNHIDEVVESHISNGQFFDENLKDIPGVEMIKYYPGSQPSYWLYTLKVDNRADFIRKLAEYNISASELHKRNDIHSYLNDFNQSLPNLDRFYTKMVHIPCGWWIKEEDRHHIVNVIKSGW